MMNHRVTISFSTLAMLASLGLAQGTTQSDEKLPPVYSVSMPVTSTVLEPAYGVLKMKLDTRLQSNKSHAGDTFTATLDTGKAKDYFGLPAGTKIEGHVVKAQAREGKTPGSLELQPDSIILADGTRQPIDASFMKIERKSVTKENGRMMATPNYRSGGTNYIATGAAIGIVAAALTGSDIIAGGIIGAAVGYLVGMSNNSRYAQDVTLKPGTVLGVRFNKDTPIDIPVNN